MFFFHKDVCHPTPPGEEDLKQILDFCLESVMNFVGIPSLNVFGQSESNSVPSLELIFGSIRVEFSSVTLDETYRHIQYIRLIQSTKRRVEVDGVKLREGLFYSETYGPLPHSPLSGPPYLTGSSFYTFLCHVTNYFPPEET